MSDDAANVVKTIRLIDQGNFSDATISTGGDLSITVEDFHGMNGFRVRSKMGVDQWIPVENVSQVFLTTASEAAELANIHKKALQKAELARIEEATRKAEIEAARRVLERQKEEEAAAEAVKETKRGPGRPAKGSN